jgi:hypothetical protein
MNSLNGQLSVAGCPLLRGLSRRGGFLVRGAWPMQIINLRYGRLQACATPDSGQVSQSVAPRRSAFFGERFPGFWGRHSVRKAGKFPAIPAFPAFDRL